MVKYDSVRYPALIDGEKGAYGVSFPDLPGIVAMGDTMDEALMNAEEALRDYVIDQRKWTAMRSRGHANWTKSWLNRARY